MLKVTDVSAKYSLSDEKYALNDVNFSVGQGERVGIIGANGAGKSSLLLTLCGVLQLSCGEISVDGIKLKKYDKKTLKALRQKIGMVFQNPDDQLFMPTVYEDIAFGPRNYGVPEAKIEADADSVFEQLGISHLKERMSHKLSGGEKRLAALAGVLVMQPSILIMDEPSSFLDPRARKRLISILDGLPQSMIVATHDLDMARDLCSRLIMLKEGRICADAPTKDILSNINLLEDSGLEAPRNL